MENTERYGQHLDIIERMVCQDIIAHKGAEIYEQIKPQIEGWIAENFGPVVRKVVIDVNGKRTKIEGTVPEILDTLIGFVVSGIPIFMVGPAGCGKSTMAEMIAKSMGIPFWMTNAVTNTAQVFGFSDAMGHYHKSSFYHAFKDGGVFLLDEVDASIPEVLTTLNAAIANGYHTFPEGLDSDMKSEAGGFVRMNKDFRLIAAGNTYGSGADYRYVGRNQLDMATLDRFVTITVGYDPKIDREMAEEDEELLFFCEEYRKLIDKFQLNAIFSYRGLKAIKAAEKFEKDTKKVLDWCLLKSMPSDDVRTLARELEQYKDLNRYVKAMCKSVKED